MEQFDQSAPTPNDAPYVQDQVIEDLKQRRDYGVQEYGTGLQPFNGRNAPVDVYEEALDKLVYIKTWVIERERIVAAFKAIAGSAEHAAAKLTAIQMLLQMGEWSEDERS